MDEKPRDGARLRQRAPRGQWPIEEFFDERNPRFADNEAALRAGFDALLAIAVPILDEMGGVQLNAPTQKA